MKLLRMELKNVRSHKHSIIDFKDGITVISGRTGCGKSSILMGIDYALFGSANVGNAEIMRRGSKEMLVVLDFIHNNKRYTIIRGLKRTANSVSIDFNNLKVLEGDKQLNVLSRANDVNQIIYELLNVPDGVKAPEMFQVTSYTKQDEIRKLIDMRREERQEYLDRILQLSRYKTTFENLKGVCSHFSSKLNELEKVQDFVKKERNELDKLVCEEKELTERKNDNDKKLKVLQEALDKKKAERKVLESGLNESEKIILAGKEKLGELNSIKNQLINYDEELKVLNKSLEVFCAVKASPKSLRDNIKGLLNNKAVLNSKIKELDEEKNSISSIGGKCPACRQDINEVHKKRLVEGITSEVKSLSLEADSVENSLNKLEADLKKAEEAESIINKKGYLEKTICELEEKRGGIKLEDTSFLEAEYKKQKEVFNNFLEKEKELVSKYAGVKEISSLLDEQLNRTVNSLREKKDNIKCYESELESVAKIGVLLKLLNNIRDYVKEVRSIIRQKFLTDFRNEFQRKFEEIRSQEEDYSVEVNNDYEPVAYTNSGEGVPIFHLSGGEKTSVALSYRLALSDLAAQMSNVMPSEILILDEPTTGFDNEDVKALPAALKNISFIPQIIIVTHQAILKEIADNLIDVKKKGNESIVEF